MSYTRQIGYLVDMRTAETPELDSKIKNELRLTDRDFLNLCAGRLFLTCRQQESLFSMLNVSFEEVQNPAVDAYTSRVHCMTAFSDTKNLDLVLDLIDAYVDAKEAETAN